MRERRWTMLVLALVTGLTAAAPTATAQPLLRNGDFEGFNTPSVPVYRFGPAPDVAPWGRAYNGGWDAAGLASSWTDTPAGGFWSGGFVARTEDFAAGWKWARSGVIFGGIKDQQVMSQTFTYNGTQEATGSLSWYDAGRPSWRTNSWFGLPNDYSVTITDLDPLGNTQMIGSFTSQVAGGLEANSAIDAPDARWSEANKKAWLGRSGQTFTLLPGRTYTLNFNSRSPINPDGSIQDRTTLLDDISLTVTTVPEPSTALLAGAGLLAVAAMRRRAVRRRNGAA